MVGIGGPELELTDGTFARRVSLGLHRTSVRFDTSINF